MISILGTRPILSLPDLHLTGGEVVLSILRTRLLQPPARSAVDMGREVVLSILGTRLLQAVAIFIASIGREAV